MKALEFVAKKKEPSILADSRAQTKINTLLVYKVFSIF